MSKLDQYIEFTNEVRTAASGRWDLILARLVPEVADALARPGRHVTCPFHGGKGDFRVERDVADEGRAHCTCGHWDGFALVMKARGWDFNQSVAEVDAVIGGKGCVPIPNKPIQRITPEEQTKKNETWIRNMQKWWRESVPLDHPSATPARRFLQSRKLGQIILPLDDLGFHPGLDYYDEDFNLVGRFPAIVAIVRMPDGRVSTVHRTYLTPEGAKAFEGEATRKQYKSPTTHPVQGGAIRLDKVVGPVLNLAEGIESALAARAITEQPTWSTLNKELLRIVRIPAQVKIVTIWADRDASYGGQEAAIALMDRLRGEGVSAVTMLPNFKIPAGAKSLDWNDVLATLGLQDTRNHFDVVRWARGQAEFLRKNGVDVERLRRKAS
jgi:putative DNA primase/helicase